MDIILYIALNIQEGESLSINVNPSHLEFARDLAQRASEITLQQVNIVVIQNGIPGDAIAVTPVMHDLMSAPPTSFALLRIDDTEDRKWTIEADPLEISKSMTLLQKAGNLAPPQLDRQVAPWSVVAVPGPSWAARLLGPRATADDLWEALADTLKLTAANPREAWRDQVSLISHRLSELNRHDIETLRLQSSQTDISVSLAAESRWRGGIGVLPNGRAFLPYLPLDRVSMLPDRTATEGTLVASGPFPLLGGVVEHASITFSQGVAVDFDARKGKKLLAIAFGIDEGAKRLGELSLVDGDAPLERIPACHFGYAGFDENATSSVTMGMGEAQHLEALESYADALELQEQTGCNTSDLRVRIPIGTSDLSVTASLSDGTCIDIMYGGRLIV